MAADDTNNNYDALLSLASSDREAFGLLYDIYYDRIAKYCANSIRSRQIALDVISSVFIYASANSKDFSGRTREDFEIWLYSIATEHIGKSLSVAEVKKSIIAENAFSSEMSAELLYICIVNLKPSARAIIFLRFCENLSYSQISRVIHSSAETLRTDILNILSSLRQQIADCGIPTEGLLDTEKQFEQLALLLNTDYLFLSEHKQRLRVKMLAAFNMPKSQSNYNAAYFALAAVVLVLIMVLLWSYFSDELQAPADTVYLPSSPPSESAESVSSSSVYSPEQQYSQSARLARIKALAADGNIPALLELLKSEVLAERLLAAKFLAVLTDSNTADFLKLASLPSESVSSDTPDKQFITVGGFLRDTKLQPIADAQVFIQPSQSCFTDANGFWQMQIAFDSDACDIELKVFAEGYDCDDTYRKAGLESLKNFTNTLLLQRGRPVKGIVVDFSGNPVEAEISVGQLFIRKTVRSGSDGKFNIDFLASGKETFTVASPLYAPLIMDVNISSDGADGIVLQLPPANIISARIVDENSEPLTGVSVSLSSWQGFDTLHFSTVTDANGFWQWSSAPADEVLFDFSKAGFEAVYDFPMQADNDYVISMQPLE